MKFLPPIDPVVHVPSVREVTSEKGRNLTKFFETQIQFLNALHALGSLSTWKLKKRRAGSFLSPYWPASSLSSILTYWNISIHANILYSFWYILMLLNQYKSTSILTKEMSSSAQSSAIVSRFFTIWDFKSVRFYSSSSFSEVLDLSDFI